MSSSPQPPPGLGHLRELARRHGIEALGVARAEPFTSTLEDLRSRKARGLAADMQFTYRNPERSTDPSRALPGASSLVVGAMSYVREPGQVAIRGPAGRVARYVWDDHYARLRLGLRAVADELESRGWRTRLLVDDNALVDREAAYRAGLGWYGKNANLLLPGRGSWFVLGSVLTDAHLPAGRPVADGCGTCERCLTSCPTGAIVAPGVIDARRCLAWLVQARGSFPAEHRVALGTRIYGCDDCQDVCPPNRVQDRRPGAHRQPGPRPLVPLLVMLESDDATLMAEYGAWYIADRDPRYLRRNALIALANAGIVDNRVRACLQAYLAGDDPMLRAHAVWAHKRLGLGLPDHLDDDPAPEVRAEVQREVEPVGCG